MAAVIRDAAPGDIPGAAAIYNQCVRETVATFDVEERGEASLGAALAGLGPLDHFLVAEEAGVVVGYALSGSFRPRPAYAGTRETSVYVAASARGQGLGGRLYTELLGRLDAGGAHTVLAVIARPNDASEALHRAFGFELVGVLR